MNSSTPSPLDILNGDVQDTKIAVECDQLHPMACTLVNYALTQALAGLTGVRAFMPIFLVAVGTKVMDDFPLTLSSSSWLESWLAIIALGILLLLEVIVDCIPVLDEIEDAVMTIVKPSMAIALALTPMYYAMEGSSESVLIQVISAVNAGILSEFIALVKAVETVAVDFSSGGLGAPARSALEDIAVFGMTFLLLLFGFWMAVTFITVLLALMAWWIVHRKRQGLPLMPRPTLPCSKSKTNSDVESSSEWESSSES